MVLTWAATFPCDTETECAGTLQIAFVRYVLLESFHSTGSGTSAVKSHHSVSTISAQPPLTFTHTVD